MRVSISRVVRGYAVSRGPQALCSRDGGLSVIVGAGGRRRFQDWDTAEADGFLVMGFAEAVAAAVVLTGAVALLGPEALPLRPRRRFARAAGWVASGIAAGLALGFGFDRLVVHRAPATPPGLAEDGLTEAPALPMLMAGPELAVTVTGVEVVRLPPLSVATAVIVKMPLAGGVQGAV